MSRQKVVLAILLAIMGLAIGYAYWASPRQERASSAVAVSAKSKRVREVPTEVTPTDKRRVRLEILERGVDAFSEPQRDIFRLAQPRPAVPVFTPVFTPPQPISQPVPQPAQIAIPAPMPGPMVHFNFLGTLLKEGRKTVFLSLDNDIFIAKEGDLFGKNKEFMVEKITDEKVIVREGDRTFTVTIPPVDKTSEISLSPGEPVNRRFVNPRESSRRAAFIPPPRPVTAEAKDDSVEAPEEPVEPDSSIQEGTLPEEPAPGEAADGNSSSLQLRSMIQ